MSVERATIRTSKARRSIKLPGKSATLAATDPADIARDLRSKSALGRMEAKLDEAERKLANG